MPNPAVDIWVKVYKELVDPEYNPTQALIRERIAPHLKSALKHLGGDEAELERRARNFMSDEWVRAAGCPTGLFLRDLDSPRCKGLDVAGDKWA
jgi:hypothetical protein